MIPSYLTYITGLSFADLQNEHPSQLVRRKTAFHRSALHLCNRFKKFIRLFEMFTGLFLVLVGVLIYFDRLSRLAGYATIMLGRF